MDYKEIRNDIKNQIKTKEIINPFTNETMTLNDWKEINRTIRNKLKDMGVKCKGSFYNPIDEKIYIKQSFRNIRIGGLVQWTCTMEDFMMAQELTSEPKGFYLDDEYFSISCSRNINFLL